jgi:DNA helicase TIP49 (TBP-interacting protein)
MFVHCALQILAIRAQVEDIDIDEESLAFLGEVGQQTSLRYGSCFCSGLFPHLLVLCKDFVCRIK